MSELWSDFWQVFRFDLGRQGARRAYRITTFVIPVLALALFFGYQALQSLDLGGGDDPEAAETEAVEQELTAGYVDRSGLYDGPGSFAGVLFPYPDQDAALAALLAGEVGTVYVVEEDYLDSGAVTQYLTDFSLGSLAIDDVFTAFLMQGLAGDVDPGVMLRLRTPPNLVEHRLSVDGEASQAQSEGAAFALVYVFGFALILSVFFSGGYLMQSIIEEKETRMVEIVLSTMRPLPLLLGKVLASGLLGLVQIVIWLVTALIILQGIGGIIPSLSGIDVAPGMLVWMLLYFVLGYLFFGGLFAVIGAISTSMREGPQYTVVVTLPAMIPFYFLYLFTETPNAALPVILSLFPMTSPLAMVQRLVVTPVPFWELLSSLALLLLAAFGAVWLAARFFRVNMLLAGQMPKLRDLARIVREG